MSENLKPSEVLAKAADLIEPEGAWTRESYARDAWGAPSQIGEGVCFCAEGALFRAMDDSDYDGPLSPFRYLADVIASHHTIPEWNDDPVRTQAEVVATLREASKLAKAEGQ